MRKVKKYSYSIEDGTDDCFNPCKVLTIALIFDNEDEEFISDITVVNEEDDYIKQLCVDTIENYGYEFV